MLRLAEDDTRMMDGSAGPAVAFCMGLLWRTGLALGADSFIPVTRAHVDGCLFHGQVSLDFVDHLLALGARVRVPTTLNVGSIDLIHPELFNGDRQVGADGRRLMEAHLALGCTPSFTCAPYQSLFRPRLGEQIAWAESNAIVFANSVLGARTARYGDFLDMAAAVTGRVPYAGLHRAEARLGQILFRIDPAAVATLPAEAVAVATGYVIGVEADEDIPVVEGLPASLTEDDLKALGAVAASSGAVAMFHAIGLTPEAPDCRTAFGGRSPAGVVEVTKARLVDALNRLSTAADGAPLGAVALGTPHFSIAEFARLVALLDGFAAAPGVGLYVNCGRDVFAVLRSRGWDKLLEAAGFTLVVDTCTYVTAVMREIRGAVMTNSGKWAHYAPNNLGVDVAFGSLEDCLASAAGGRVVRLRPW